MNKWLVTAVELLGIIYIAIICGFLLACIALALIAAVGWYICHLG